VLSKPQGCLSKLVRPNDVQEILANKSDSKKREFSDEMLAYMMEDEARKEKLIEKMRNKLNTKTTK
jgi:hypothetical protein